MDGRCDTEELRGHLLLYIARNRRPAGGRGAPLNSRACAGDRRGSLPMRSGEVQAQR